jgi:hypothetical protein
VIAVAPAASAAPATLGGAVERSEEGFAGALADAVGEVAPVEASERPTSSAKPARKPKLGSVALALPVMPAFPQVAVIPQAPAVVAMLTSDVLPAGAPGLASSNPRTATPSLAAVSGQAATPSFGAVSGPAAMPSFTAVSGQAATPSFGAVSGPAATPSFTAVSGPAATPSFTAVSGQAAALSEPAARPAAPTGEGGSVVSAAVSASPVDSARALVAELAPLPNGPLSSVPASSAVLSLSDALPVAADALDAEPRSSTTVRAESAPDSSESDAPLVARSAAGPPRVSASAVAPRALVTSAEPASAAAPKSAPATVVPAADAQVARPEIRSDMAASLGGAGGWAPDDVDPDALGDAGVLVSMNEPAVRVRAPVNSVLALHTVDATLPELPAPAVPDQLHLSVRDPLGDWTLDVRRHEHGLDLLFSAPGSLAPVVAGAEHDLRALLASHGHSLASLDFQEQGRQGGREAPYASEPAPHAPGSSARRAAKSASNTTSGASPRGQQGMNLNRVA